MAKKKTKPDELFIGRMKMAVEAAGNQTILAKLSGVSQTTISSYENGSEPSRVNLIAIAKAVGFSVLWLAIGEGPIKNDSVAGGDVTTTAGKNAVVTPIKGSGVKVNIKLNDQSAEQPQCDTDKIHLSEKEKIVVMLLRKIGEETTIDNCIAKLKDVYEVKKW